MLLRPALKVVGCLAASTIAAVGLAAPAHASNAAGCTATYIGNIPPDREPVPNGELVTVGKEIVIRPNVAIEYVDFGVAVASATAFYEIEQLDAYINCI